MNPSENIIRTILRAGVLAGILVCLAVAYGTARASRNGTLCESLDITVKDSTESRFVTERDIREYIAAEYGNIDGIPVNDLDLKKIETILDAQSAILKSEAYCTTDGKLNISVTQRKPIMRFQKGNSSFYADGNGYIFPMKSGRASYVVVIDGAIPLGLDGKKGKAVSGKEGEWLGRMTELVNYMLEHRIWEENIVQIHVRENGDLILVPRDGREKFIFGKPVSIKEKFTLMDCYYTGIVPAKGKDCYGTVDLRYEGQIICK